MKTIILTLCLFLSGCVALVPKKATLEEEKHIAQILNTHNYKLGTGSVKYLGEDFYNARHYYGYAWSNEIAGQFIIVVDYKLGTREVFWSQNGEFPELDRRVSLSMPPLL